MKSSKATLIALYAATFLGASCNKEAAKDPDDSDSTETTTVTSGSSGVATGSTDKLPPTVNGDSLAATDVMAQSLTLLWDEAADDTTTAANLKTRVYVSSKNNLDTAADVEANGTALNELTAGITTLPITGLEPSTAYYFNVLVLDEAGNKSVYTSIEVTTVAESTTSPTPSPSSSPASTSAPTHTASALTFTDSDTDVAKLGGTVTITKATDESDVSSYELYYGSSSSAKLSGSTEIASLTTTGSNLTYTFTSGTSLPSGATHLLVFTKNSHGEMSTGTSAQIADAVPIVLFTAGAVATNFGGRSGGDALCSAAKAQSYSMWSCSNIRAFVTVSAGDQIADMTTNYSVPTSKKIEGPNGTVVDTNWSDLMSGSITNSLATAGVLDSGGSWFSGSDYYGAMYTAETCTGWMATSGGGRIGFANTATGLWISQNNSLCLSYATFNLLCVCY